MPLDPNHIHADTPHAKTVHLASQGSRCKVQRQQPDRAAVALYLPGVNAGVSRGF